MSLNSARRSLPAFLAAAWWLGGAGCGTLGAAEDPTAWQEVVIETKVPVIVNVKPAPFPGEVAPKLPKLVAWGVACQLECSFDLLPGRYQVGLEGSRIMSGTQTIDLRRASAFEVIPGDEDSLDMANSMEIMGLIATIVGVAGAAVGGALWGVADPDGEVVGQGLVGSGAGVAAVGTALIVWGAVKTSQSSTRLEPRDLRGRGLPPLPELPDEPPSD